MAGDADLVVLGAGPAGLAAGYRAANLGCRVTVLERADRVGGLAGSFEVAGVRVDHGSHRLHPATEPRILADLRTLLGDDLQTRRRNGRIRLAGRWIPFPLRTAATLRGLPPGFALGAAADTLTTWRRRPAADTFAERLRAGLGRTMCERFYFPYARKLWGLEPDELSAEHARSRVGAGGPAALAARLVRGGRGEAGIFYYPRRGYGQLWERLAEAAVDAGAELHLNTVVSRVGLDGDHVEVDTAAGSRVEGGRVWSTIPVSALVNLVNPAPPEDVRAAAHGLRHRAMVLVYVALATRRHTSFDAHYLPEEWTPLTRVSEPTNYRDGAGVDPDDRTVLCGELPCAVGDRWWEASDDELAEVVRDTLRRAGLADPPVLEVATKRLPAVYPVYPAGDEAAFDPIEEWVTRQPGLLSFGRQGLFTHTNAHHVLAMAWAAADALRPAGGFDDDAWRRARAHFRDYVVED